MSIAENSQGNFVRDRHVEDPDLEEKIRELIEIRGTFKRYNKLQREIKEGIRTHIDPDEEADGTRIIIGPFVAEVKERAGGGFEIPTWEKNVVGNFKATVE